MNHVKSISENSKVHMQKHVEIGYRWIFNQCKGLQLLVRCLQSDQSTSLPKTMASASGTKTFKQKLVAKMEQKSRKTRHNKPCAIQCPMAILFVKVAAKQQGAGTLRSRHAIIYVCLSKTCGAFVCCYCLSNQKIRMSMCLQKLVLNISSSW